MSNRGQAACDGRPALCRVMGPMIEVRVKLYANLVAAVPAEVAARYGSPIRAGAVLTVDLADGGTVADVVDALMLPRAKVRIAFVNGRIRPLATRLAEHDEIGLFPAVGGG